MEQAMEWALTMGYNAVVLTDHNTMEGVREAVRLTEVDERFRGKLVVIPGLEYTSCRVHM